MNQSKTSFVPRRASVTNFASLQLRSRPDPPLVIHVNRAFGCSGSAIWHFPRSNSSAARSIALSTLIREHPLVDWPHFHACNRSL
ncbi:hypothetical protein DTO271G3_7225 [Paecilomyces variotii]|nr:hypothetical protein DTO271G3_7225 [Paecilomyces variotii]